MNICFFSGDITNSGGTERVATIVANNLIVDSKYDVSFISLVEKRENTFFHIDEKIKHTPLYKKPVRGITHIVQIIHKVREYIINNKIDVLIDIDGILDMYSIPAKRFTKAKVISWEHFNFYQNPAVPYRKYTRKLAGKKADAIVTLTESDKNFYLDNIKIKRKIDYIYNPIIVNKFETEYNINLKTILSVGRLTSQKGFDMLVEVAKKVLPKHKDWKWLILGEGEDREILEKAIRENNLAQQLILKGNVTNVNEYYSQSSIFVLTSRFEGLPMTLLETRPYKLPIVSFNCKTGPSEMIENGVNGYLIDEFEIDDMAEKINMLIENDKMRLDFSNHANDDSEKFNLQSIMNKWFILLDELE